MILGDPAPLRRFGESLLFFPRPDCSPELATLGFRSGDRGTHSSRTLMLSDLEAVLAVAPGPAKRDRYVAAIIDDNCLHKPTAATRRLSVQRLSELYALDPRIAIFRVLRHLWAADSEGHSLLAILVALARDPLLRASAWPVLAQPIGAEIHRAPIGDAIREQVGERMNEATVGKVTRNVASTWTQTGHLAGRTFKSRQRVAARPSACALALWISNAVGFRGEDLLANGWMASLDCTPPAARALAMEAKRIGLIDLRIAGDVIELGLERLDPRQRGA